MLSLTFLAWTIFHGVVISCMPLIFSGKLAQRIKDVDVVGYFLQFDTCQYENLKHCYNHSGIGSLTECTRKWRIYSICHIVCTWKWRIYCFLFPRKWVRDNILHLNRKKNENSGKYILNISLLKKSGFYAIAWLVDISDWILYHLISIVIVLWLFWMTNKLCYVLTDKLCWCLTR